MRDKNNNMEKMEDLEIPEEETDDEMSGKSEKNDAENENCKKAEGVIVKKLEAKLEAAEQEKEEYEDRWKRAYAEFENYKKRSVREREKSRKFANESLLRALLPVVDNMERAIESSSDNGEIAESSIAQGVDMTLKEIVKVFEKFGVKAVSSMGQSFDPGIHEAMMQEESEEHPGNTVIRELQKGYMLHDRLLRPAMVTVSKAKTDDEKKMKKK